MGATLTDTPGERIAGERIGGDATVIGAGMAASVTSHGDATVIGAGIA
jgi:hypothetical protein